jgi:hypothetical protein
MFDLSESLFDWRDLHGKQLTIHVEQDENWLVVSGVDNNGVMYVLHTEEI